MVDDCAETPLDGIVVATTANAIRTAVRVILLIVRY
jgi:hypothetical protein